MFITQLDNVTKTSKSAAASGVNGKANNNKNIWDGSSGGSDSTDNVEDLPNTPIDANKLTPAHFSHMKTTNNPEAYKQALARAKAVIPHINKYARQNDIPPSLVMCFIDKETNFQTKAKNASGAAGLMQLMPSTAKGFFTAKEKKDLGLDKLSGEELKAKVSNILLEPEWGVKLGCRYLKELSNSKHGDIGQMYKAYTGTTKGLSSFKSTLGEHLDD